MHKLKKIANRYKRTDRPYLKNIFAFKMYKSFGVYLSLQKIILVKKRTIESISFINLFKAAISKDDWHHSMGTPAGWKPGDQFVRIDIITRAVGLNLEDQNSQVSQKTGSMGLRFL